MLTSGFFNARLVSGEYDRVYSAEDFAEYFSILIKNGVFPDPATNLQVSANNPNDMSIIVSPGFGWINGYYCKNSDDYPLDIGVADGSLPRIDGVVLRWSQEARSISLAVKAGTPAASPQAPALERSVEIYELMIASVRVPAGATSISQSIITDTRSNNSVCGWVTSLIDQIDTTNLFAQYDSAFNAWFDDLKAQLSGDVATNLMNQINALEDDVEAKWLDTLSNRTKALYGKTSIATPDEIFAKLASAQYALNGHRYCVVFKQSTSFTLPSDLLDNEVFAAVAGGGGGGGGYANWLDETDAYANGGNGGSGGGGGTYGGGGGGGGGYVKLAKIATSAGATATIVIGSGGAGGASGASGTAEAGSAGGQSSLKIGSTTVTAAGGSGGSLCVDNPSSSKGGNGSTYGGGGGGGGSYGNGGTGGTYGGGGGSYAGSGGTGGTYGGTGGTYQTNNTGGAIFTDSPFTFAPYMLIPEHSFPVDKKRGGNSFGGNGGVNEGNYAGGGGGGYCSNGGKTSGSTYSGGGGGGGFGEDGGANNGSGGGGGGGFLNLGGAGGAGANSSNSSASKGSDGVVVLIYRRKMYGVSGV